MKHKIDSHATCVNIVNLRTPRMNSWIPSITDILDKVIQREREKLRSYQKVTFAVRSDKQARKYLFHIRFCSVWANRNDLLQKPRFTIRRRADILWIWSCDTTLTKSWLLKHSQKLGRIRQNADNEYFLIFIAECSFTEKTMTCCSFQWSAKKPFLWFL